MGLNLEHWILKDKEAANLPTTIGKIVHQQDMGLVTAEFRIAGYKPAVTWKGLQVIMPTIDLLLRDNQTGEERKALADIGRE